MIVEKVEPRLYNETILKIGVKYVKCLKVEFNFNKEMKNILITEQQFKSLVENAFNEELHVADEVIKAFNEIKYEICKNLKTIPLKTNVIIVPYRENEIKVEAFGSELSIEYCCYFLDPSSDIGDIIEHLPLGSSINNSNKKLSINFIQIGKNFIDPRYFDDALQHELAHYYQFIKKGGTDLIPNNKLYTQALQYLSDKIGNNGFNYILALIIYLSHKQEWDGFINGSYAMLISCDITSKADLNFYLEQTESFRYLQNLKYYQTVLIEHENDPDLINAINTVSTKTYKWYMRNIDYTIKNLTKKIKGLKRKFLKNFN